ncbi:MAG TPA: hypothetical protein VK654_14640 [Nitrospirota bacterium]|nr:hypothetical protein [Nitrospirota bacterium]
MKKFLVVLTVLALVVISSMAFAAAEVTVGGSVQIRSRDFQNLNFNKSADANDTVDTQERIILDVNVKADGVKGKISLWNDFNDWGRFEATQGNDFGSGTTTGTTQGAGNGQFGFREAWVSFNVPGIPVNVTGGHQLLMLGMGGFFRSMHFGTDAWVIANVTGPNTAAVVNLKVAENNVGKNDDVDDYTLLDVFKINENNTVGIDLSQIVVHKSSGYTFGSASIGDAALDNIGVNYTGKIGPVNLKGELDWQTGKVKRAGGAPLPSEIKFKGNQIWINGNVPVDPVTINFTLARGSGNKRENTAGGAVNADVDLKQMFTLLDIDPHYTFLYEYKTATACASPFALGGTAHTGFCNTTAISAGAAVKPVKSLMVGLDIWYLQATEKSGTPLAYGSTTGKTSSDVGTEIDATINWQLYDNLSWNWNIGYFKPGDAMKTSDTAHTDAATGIQSFLP